jgi:hypothetical protein
MWSSKRALGAVAVSLLAATAGGSAGAANLADIQAYPERGQSPDRTRRDRYECHNWAVEQTGRVPGPGAPADAVKRERRAERIGKIIAGAGIGAALGGLIRGADDRGDAADGALGGAVLGAAAGAAAGASAEEEPEDEVFDAYFRALGACMEGRGYELAIVEAEVTAAR